MTQHWDRAVCVAQVHQHLRGWELVERRGGHYRVTDAGRRVLGERGGLGAVYGLFRTDPWTGRDLATGIPATARPEVAAMLQEAAREASGGIGVLLVGEAPHGEMSHGSVQLPTNLAQAATWSPELVREGADSVGRSARADGMHLVLCSGMDMMRDPRWGRSEETYGEDPWLASLMIAAQVRGLQGGDTLQPATHPGAVVKHFAGQGDAGGGRNAGSAALGNAEFWELHLPAAEAAVRAGAVGVMAAYNDVDGLPCIGNQWLLTGLLRHLWLFDGVVMADALAIDRLAENLGPRRAAHEALRAGCDLNLGDESWSELDREGDDAVEAALRRAAVRVRMLKERFGLMPGGAETLPPAVPESVVAEASLNLARAGITSIDGAFTPIDPNAKVVVTGPFVDSIESMLGDYATPVDPDRFRSLVDALRDRIPDAVAVPWRSKELLATARDADVVVVQVGGTSERRYGDEFADTGARALRAGDLWATCGEGVDLADLSLPHGQDDQLRSLRVATAARLVVVAVMGRPHVLTTARAAADDLLIAWYPGPFGGEAIADVLVGRAAATGRLPVTLLSHPGALGWHDNDRVGQVEGAYADVATPVLARVGDGAATRIRVGEPSVTRSADRIRVTTTIEALDPGTEVIRLYGRRSGGLRWPRRRILLGALRLQLARAERREVTFDVTVDDLFGVDSHGHGSVEPDAARHCTLTLLPSGVTLAMDRTIPGD